MGRQIRERVVIGAVYPPGLAGCAALVGPGKGVFWVGKLGVQDGRVQ